MEQGGPASDAAREMPLDKLVKVILLSFHFLGFSVWYGGVVLGIEAGALYPAMATISGVLLTLRELYDDGTGWLFETEGVLTMLKVLLLLASWTLGQGEVIVLGVVMVLGILGSHLPARIKKKRLLPWP